MRLVSLDAMVIGARTPLRCAVTPRVHPVQIVRRNAHTIFQVRSCITWGGAICQSIPRPLLMRLHWYYTCPLKRGLLILSTHIHPDFIRRFSSVFKVSFWIHRQCVIRLMFSLLISWNISTHALLWVKVRSSPVKPLPN